MYFPICIVSICIFRVVLVQCSSSDCSTLCYFCFLHRYIQEHDYQSVAFWTVSRVALYFAICTSRLELSELCFPICIFRLVSDLYFPICRFRFVLFQLVFSDLYVVDLYVRICIPRFVFLRFVSSDLYFPDRYFPNCIFWNISSGLYFPICISRFVVPDFHFPIHSIWAVILRFVFSELY